MMRHDRQKLIQAAVKPIVAPSNTAMMGENCSDMIRAVVRAIVSELNTLPIAKN